MSKCILITIPNFHTAGSQHVVLNLYRNHKNEGYKVYILIEDETGYAPGEVSASDLLVLPKAGYLNFTGGVKYAIRLKNLLQNANIGVLHSWDYRSEIWEALACKMAGIPYVYTKKNNSWSRKWILKSVFSKHIVYDNPDMKQRFFSSRWFDQKTSFIPHGINTMLFYLDEAVKTCSWTIGCVGNIGSNKNQIALLKTLPLIDEKVKIEFYGNADANYLKQLEIYLERTGMMHRIEFKGLLDNSQLPDVLRRFDLLVLCSFNEGLPVILLEALACGTYCIASNSGGGSVYIAGKCGGVDIFMPDDTHTLANLINEYYANWSNKNQCAMKASEKVAEHFSDRIEAKKYLQLFSSLQLRFQNGKVKSH